MTEFFDSLVPALYDLSLPVVVPGLFPARMIRADLMDRNLNSRRSWIGADLGVGTGSDAASMIPIRSTGTLYGLDSSLSLTRELRETRRLPGDRHPNVDVEVISTDLTSAPAVRTLACDFVSSSFAIHNIERSEQAHAFALAGHLLRPGGIFLYLDLVSYEDSDLERHAHSYDLEFIKHEMKPVPPHVDQLTWRTLQKRWLKHYEEENFLVPLQSTSSRPDLCRMFADAGLTAPTMLYRLLHTTLIVATKRF